MTALEQASAESSTIWDAIEVVDPATISIAPPPIVVFPPIPLHVRRLTAAELEPIAATLSVEQADVG